jgi:uncharacterized protein (TIGR04255 family)
MSFPESSREVYNRNPLAEVVVELRYPSILRIEAEIPAQFQEAIRDQFPGYAREAGAGRLPAEIPAPIRELIRGMGAAAGPVQHAFRTQMQTAGIPVSQVTLSRDAMTFKTTAYTRWEAFRQEFHRVRAALEEIYRPTAYTRVGLRYVNVIRRSKLELTGIAWRELLNEAIGGELCADEFGERIDSAQRQLHCELGGDNCFLAMRTGIALTEEATSGSPKEKCFVIDCDFHTHRSTEIPNVPGTLDAFNRVSGRLFRWAIRPRLRDALQPQPME